MGKHLRRVSTIAVLAMLLMLSGCTLTFTLEGASPYTIMPDGRVLDESLSESEIEMELTTKGFMFKLPVVLEVELEGLIMSTSMEPGEIDAALITIGDYLRTQMDFGSYTSDPATDTFWVTGLYTLEDFWTALDILSPGTMLGPYTIPLKLIIGQTAYDGLVGSITNVSNTMIEDGTSINFLLEGYLKTITEQTVGTLVLQFVTINPV